VKPLRNASTDRPPQWAIESGNASGCGLAHLSAPLRECTAVAFVFVGSGAARMLAMLADTVRR
jgi:hypothetical protein